MSLRLRFAAAMVMAVAAMPQGWAYDWATVATVSDTVGINSGHLCVGLTRGDIGCAANAPSVNANGDLTVYGNLNVSGSQIFQGVTFANGGVSATGTITATTFYGDGAGITGIDFSLNPLDRIVSGTTQVLANQNQSITIGTAGTQRMVVGANGNVGIGIANPGVKLEVRTVSYTTDGFRVASDLGGGMMFGPSSNAGSWNALVNKGDQVFIFNGGSINTGNLVIAPWSGTRSGLRMISNGYVSLGGSITPTTVLDISGTLKLANGGEACDTDRIGAIKYDTGAFYICQSTTNGWEALATTGANSLADRITSGTTQVITNGPGNSISFTVNGTTTGYFYNGQLVANAVSTTGPGKFNSISVTTNGYFGGNVGIGAAPAQRRLNITQGSDTEDSGLGILNTAVSNAGKLWMNGAAFILQNGTYTNQLVLLPSGNIGIGTTAPAYSLDISSSAIRLYTTANAVPGNAYIQFAAADESNLGWIGDGSPQRNVMGMYAKNGIIFAVSSSNPVLTLNSNTLVGINTTTPTVALDVSGTLKIANGGEACDTTRLGAIKYQSGAFYICQDTSHDWEPLATTGAFSASDRITSGTTNVITNGAGNSISFTVGGVTTGYFYNGMLVANGVSTTGTISGSSGYFAGNVGIGTPTPDTALVVSQTIFGSVNGAANFIAYNNTYPANNGGHGIIYVTNGDDASDAYGGIIFRANDDLGTARHGAAIMMGKEGLWQDIAPFGSYPGYLSFWTRNGGAGGGEAERMRITSTGNVGIGTTSPTSALTVSGSIGVVSNGAIFVKNDFARPAMAFMASDGTYYPNVAERWEIYPHGIGSSPTSTASLFDINTRSTSTTITRLSLSSNGAVMLGTSSGGDACDTSHLGGIKYQGNTFYVCQNTTDGWQSLATSGGTSGSPDRITSGTTSVTANTTGYISLTTGGATTGYFDTSGRLIVPGVSITTANGISSTNGYFSGPITVSSTAILPVYVTGPDAQTLYMSVEKMGGVARVGTGTSGAGVFWPLFFGRAVGSLYPTQLLGEISATDDIGSAPGVVVSARITGNTPLLTRPVFAVKNNTTTNLLVDAAGKVGIGTTSPSVTLDVNGTISTTLLVWGPKTDKSLLTYYPPGDYSVLSNASTTWENSLRIGNGSFSVYVSNTATSATVAIVAKGNGVGINGKGSPDAALDVSGTLKIANSAEACDTSHLGAIKYQSNAFYICQDVAHDWEPLATTGAFAAADRITSGTTNVITNGPGNSISFTVGGVTTGYFYNGMLVASGVSTTGAVSGSSGYFAGKVGIGTTQPDAPLSVVGSGGTLFTISATTGGAGMRIKAVSPGFSYLDFYQGGINIGNIRSDPAGYFVINAQATNTILNPAGGNVGIRTATPTTALDVSGSLKISNGGETCGTGQYGTMRIINGVLSICRQ